MKTSPKTIEGIHSQVLELFERYAWPGNVRELENVMEHAITLARGEQIMSSDLPHTIIKMMDDQNSHTNHVLTTLSLAELKQRKVDEIEKKYLIEMLKEYNGNVTQVALRAQMTRRNIHRLFHRHQIDPNYWRNVE